MHLTEFLRKIKIGYQNRTIEFGNKINSIRTLNEFAKFIKLKESYFGSK